MIETIKTRKSIRNYASTPLTKEQLDTIKEAIQFAPTWKNKQCFEVIIVEDRPLLEQIGTLVRNNPCVNAYTQAPVVMVFVADPTKSGNRDEKPYYIADTAIAVEHAHLAAASLGLGSCWVGVFPENDLKALLNIPEHLRIVALLPIGYPLEEPIARPRRAMEDIFHTNKY